MFIFKKNTVEIYRNGKWEAVEKQYDFKRTGKYIFFSTLLLALIFGVLQAFYIGSTKKKLAELSANFPSKQALVGKIKFADLDLFVDRSGQLYRVRGKTLELFDKSLISLSPAETIETAVSVSKGVVLGINNRENGNLIKFVIVDESRTVREEKIIFGRSLAECATFDDNIFLTDSNTIILRRENEQNPIYSEIRLSREIKNISDVKFSDNNIFILERSGSLYRIETANTGLLKPVIEILISITGEDGRVKSNNPLIIQAYKTRVVITTTEGFLEEYFLEDGKTRLMSQIPLEEVALKKPDFLGNFLIIKTENTPDFCLVSRREAKCPFLANNTKAFVADNTRLLLSLNNDYWFAP